MMMSRVHVQLSIWKVGGQQTKYGGHTILFPRDTASLAERLPLLPAELDVIILRRKGAPAVHNTAMRNDFTVNRQRVIDNLQALKRYHPSYRDIVISDDALALLPENGSVFDQLPSMDDAAPQPEPDVAQAPSDEVADRQADAEDLLLDIAPPAALVPNIVDDVSQHQRVVEGLQALLDSVPAPLDPNVVTQPALRPTPVNEHDSSYEYLIDAFPFLFPQGLADLHAVRPITKVEPNDYYRHLMRYEDARFARHPRFR
jgi:hypothetical protein